MLEVRISTSGKEFVELRILNVSDQYLAEKAGKVKHYRIMNVYGQPTFQVMDNSSWDKVVIPAIETAIKAYKKQGANPEVTA